MKKRASPNPTDIVDSRIFTFRNQRVILDADLASLYGVSTKAFNQANKRNVRRFPTDFAFQLHGQETANLRSQSVTSSQGERGATAETRNWSQFVTSSKAKHRGTTYRPWAFTEHGAVMAANVLRSPKAVEMSVCVVRAFIKQREILMTNATILRRLAGVDKTLIEHDSALQILWRKLQPLLAPPPHKPKRRIGFNASTH